MKFLKPPFWTSYPAVISSANQVQRIRCRVGSTCLPHLAMFHKEEYHPEWETISWNIKVRALDQCEECGARNGEPHPVTGSQVILAVAHLDQDRGNNHFSNLRALCARCHFAHDAGANIMRRRYGRRYMEAQMRIKFNRTAERQ